MAWYGLPSATDLWQPVDSGYWKLLKVLMTQQHNRWLGVDNNAERWYCNEKQLQSKTTQDFDSLLGRESLWETLQHWLWYFLFWNLAKNWLPYDSQWHQWREDQTGRAKRLSSPPFYVAFGSSECWAIFKWYHTCLGWAWWCGFQQWRHGANWWYLWTGQ